MKIEPIYSITETSTTAVEQYRVVDNMGFVVFYGDYAQCLGYTNSKGNQDRITITLPTTI